MLSPFCPALKPLNFRLGLCPLLCELVRTSSTPALDNGGERPFRVDGIERSEYLCLTTEIASAADKNSQKKDPRATHIGGRGASGLSWKVEGNQD